jgi:hypothetical protein
MAEYCALVAPKASNWGGMPKLLVGKDPVELR